MSEAPIVAVEIPQVGDERHKNWAKVVHSVDSTKSSGWAFVGDFIATGGIQDVPAGSVVLVYGERGSRRSPQSEAHIYVVNPDSTLSSHGSSKGRAWARTLRDVAEELLAEELPIQRGWEPDLLAFTDHALAEELVRRGWDVTPPEEA